MAWLTTLLGMLIGVLRSRAAVQIESLALRHQPGVHRQACRRPRIRATDRMFWSWLTRDWSGWNQALVIVKPETIIAWRRRRFPEFWTKRSRSGRPG